MLENLMQRVIPGTGRISAGRVGPFTRLSELRAEAPMLLRHPRSRSEKALCVVGTMGGGCLAGDRISLEVKVGEGARLALLSHGSTRMHPALLRESTLLTRARVEEGGVLGVLMDPLLPGAEANFTQRNEFHLEDGASLLVWDALSAGRVARGERWAFERALLRTEIHVGGKEQVIDATELRREDRLEESLAGVTGLSSMWLVGPVFEPHFDALEERARKSRSIVTARKGKALLVRVLCTSGHGALEPLVALTRPMASEVIDAHGWAAKGW